MYYMKENLETGCVHVDVKCSNTVRLKALLYSERLCVH